MNSSIILKIVIICSVTLFSVDAKPLDVDSDADTDADVDYVGSRLKNRLGLPFVDFGGNNKRSKNVDDRRRNVEGSVFRKLTDLLVDQLEIPIIVEAIHEVSPNKEDTTLG